MVEVPKMWDGDTVVIMGSGPSLTRSDVEYVRGKAKTIVINTTYELAPWADVLYACDGRWWRWRKGAPEFAGMKYSIDAQATCYGVTVLKSSGVEGLELRPHAIRTGRNSGYQAIGLAVHFGAKRIVLLGYDMSPGPNGEQHHHADHPNRSRSPYAKFIAAFDSIVQPLMDIGVQVVNCTRRTALACFPCLPLEDVL